MLLGVSTAFALLLAEGIVRLAWQPGTYAPVIAVHPLYGWCLQPGSRLHGIDTDRGLDYHIRVNALGHRDPEHSQEKSPGIQRVLFIGDSMTFGPGVEVGQRWTDILDTALGPGVEVLNAGVSGWGTDQEFLYLCNQGFALAPDVVVLTLCMSNDVVNNMLDHAFLDVATKPRFTLDPNGALHFEPARVPPPPPHATLNNVLKRSRLLHYVVRHAKLARAKLQEPRKPSAAIPYHPENLESDYSHWTVYKAPYSTRFEQAFRVTEALIAAADDSCRAHGVPLLVFALPEKVEVDEQARTAELTHHGFDPTWFDLQLPYERLRRLCAARNLPFLYPLDDFVRFSHEKPLYFERDAHASAAGHAAAARVLQPAIQSLLATREPEGLEATHAQHIPSP